MESLILTKDPLGYKSVITSISKSTEEICRKFSQKVYKTTAHYIEKERKQKNSFSNIQNHFDGKKSECATVNLAHRLKFNYKLPKDFLTVIEKGKSFDNDIFINFNKIHNKVQPQNSSVYEQVGPSWLFELNDPLYLGLKDSEYLALSLMKDNRTFYFYGFIQVAKIKEHWKDPLSYKLKGVKIALELRDFKDHMTLKIPYGEI